MPRRHLPSLSALRTFEAVARTLSFTKAAQELGVTQAAVSRQVKALEDQLAVELVSRGPGRNALTDSGDILFTGVYRAFQAIEQSVEQITGSGDRAILNVSVAPFFSARWLTPRLMTFLRRHPDIELRLHHAYHPADHRREGIDIGINWGSIHWPGVRREKVLDGSLTAVMSPALLARRGPLTRPEQLLDLTLLYEFDLRDWQLWFERAGGALAPQSESLRLSDSHALLRAALDGHGVALFFAELVREDLDSGRLVQPFPVCVHTGYDYFLNYPDSLELGSKGKAFRRWVLEEIERRPYA
ncbi:MAG TPA: LysR substrate-binding domain-containing protein [Xanthobacteraceae bacterium]|jgi:DNA-binding transcriptional LysR family regulator